MERGTLTEVEMYDLTGKPLFLETIDGSSFSWQIDMNEYPKGIYYLKVTSCEFSRVSKIIIQ